MDIHGFQNRIRSLFNLDYSDVQFLTPAQWTVFAYDPVKFFLRCDDPTADRIFEAVEARQKGRS